MNQRLRRYRPLSESGPDAPTPKSPGRDHSTPDRSAPNRSSPDRAKTRSVRRGCALFPYLVTPLLLLCLFGAANIALGPELAPSPLAILDALWSLAKSGELFGEMWVTVWRGLLGVFLAIAFGTILGLIAGRATRLLRFIAPLAASLQACPPIVWITLAMVWAGTGSMVPIATVVAATLPLVFSNTVQGVLSLNPRLDAMARLYDIPALVVLFTLVIPAAYPYWLAGFSTALATAWKAAAVAEFMGSHNGVGAQLFFCYGKLEMESLNAWALALIILGLTIETVIITPMRMVAASKTAKGRFQ